MYLIDTNIFLEILLKQENSRKAKDFLSLANNEMFVSEFSVFSIGIILNKLNKLNSFEVFLKGIIIDKIPILALSPEDLLDINEVTQKYKLDFDDAYQYLLAKRDELTLVTFDTDFKRTDLSIVSI